MSALLLLGEDGAFLGAATGDASAVDGVCNPSSPYGSEESPSSIFNPTGPYGNAASLLSAYHPLTLRPPYLYNSVSERYLVAVSKNTSLVPVLDPDELCSFLATTEL